MREQLFQRAAAAAQAKYEMAVWYARLAHESQESAWIDYQVDMRLAACLRGHEHVPSLF